ncbi:MAG: Eco57I restriction-modification methylase domain-containing protein [Caldilineaceae bacterium]
MIRSKTTAQQHAEWLSLLEISGPFLSLEVLLDIFPQMNLEEDDPDLRRRLRLAYEEWQDNQLGLQPDPALHRAWLHFVFTELLAMPAEVLQTAAAIPAALQTTIAEFGETLRPDLAVIDPDTQTPRLLIQLLPVSQRLEQPLAGHTWKASPATRMMELLHATTVRLGLVTNGEQWLLINAPRGETTGFISWYAQLWLDEPLTLRAWRSLLGVRRFFGVQDTATLEAMLTRSTQNQHEVTDQLGYQVRRAVELLVQAIDRASRDTGRNLLAGVSPSELYEAALTIMMRLVFLFSAEERGLLPLDDALYQRSYAASPLRSQLRAAADAFGEEVIERRTDAWCRLLTTFRAVYGGIDHERQRLPAYGGRLFDPDRFPFLEGRSANTSWITTIADPLPINNRTVLHLLEALQLLEVSTPGGERQTQRLSFRALDVEQIGHIYEGLLDHQALRAAAPMLGLTGAKDQEPELALALLETIRNQGETALIDLLKAETGRSPNALRRALATPPNLLQSQHLRAVCGNDEALYARVLPFANLLRADAFGHAVVILPDSLYVTAGVTRRSTGAHYTPRSLTEPIVQHTLEPLVYHGPAEGLPRAQWRLRSPAAILALKVCDMAMGSGAFLVQCCRYLAERLIEAIEQEAAARPRLNGHAHGHGAPQATPIDRALATLRATQDPTERLTLARRLIAERCLYGVDKNPLAVEMAKLSLWLITLDKGRPFSFLDHALKCGDSIVGIHNLDQLRCWNIDGSGARQFGTLDLDLDIQQMIRLRQAIETMPVMEIEDQYNKAAQLAKAAAIAHNLTRAADDLIASYYNDLQKGPQSALRAALLLAHRDGANVEARWRQHANLGDLQPFHWPLEFPEVFLAEGRSGFDAYIGNPPFIGGQRIRAALGGNYLQYLKTCWNHTRGSADYCAYFFLRAFENLRASGTFGLIATNTIAQGDTRELGLAYIDQVGGAIYQAEKDRPWPGQAAVVVNIIHTCKGAFNGEKQLGDKPVHHITPLLDNMPTQGNPLPLLSNSGDSFIGSYVLGMGFVMTYEEAQRLIDRNQRNKDVLFPYLNGEDLNTNPDQSPSRWIINFFDWPLQRGAPGSWQRADEQERKQWLQSGCVPDDYPNPVAVDYPDCLGIVRKQVYPQRMAQNREIRKRYWWRYGEVAPALYATIAPLSRVLVAVQTSKYISITFQPKGVVYSHMTIVFALEGNSDFALLNSSFHENWVRQYSSTLETRLRYIPSDCFGNYPFPSSLACLNTIGESYYEHRHGIMLDRQEGLTATYNRFHNPAERAADIARLRQLHTEMDHTVAAAYGWANLALDHDFHETQQGFRYTISESARREVLRRLLKLNHQRHAEEVAAGLHEKKGKKKTNGRSKETDSEQMSIFLV